MTARLLVVTAVDAEAAAIGELDGVDVLVGGVGPAAAAATTSAALGHGAYELVVSAGIGGGFAPLQPGDIAVASTVVFADLGADSPEGFLAATALGFGQHYQRPVDPQIATRLAVATGGHRGAILTVATVTGTAAETEALLQRHPDSVAEGMEGFGVCEAAAVHGVAFGELRAISNAVGPRDRDAWRIPEALQALGDAVAAVAAAAREWT